MFANAAKSLALAGLRASKQHGMEVLKGQTRSMAGAREGPGTGCWVSMLNGKPPPDWVLQDPEYVTYAGLSIRKYQVSSEDYIFRVVCSLFWFTMWWHMYLNAEDHWYGENYIFEREVQLHGWDDPEDGGTGHSKYREGALWRRPADGWNGEVDQKKYDFKPKSAKSEPAHH